MRPSSYIILVIIAFFCLVVHAIHQEDKRRVERLVQDLPHPVERRKGSRRKRSMARFAAWVVRSGWRRKPS